MDTTEDITEIIDQNDNINPLFIDNSNQKNKVKLLDNRKLEANEKFGKIGSLPNSNSLTSNEFNEGSNKVPVMDLLPGGYRGDIGFDYHRPCNCTKSYCLKLYCECFARDKLCVNCNCNNCMNNLSHEKSRSTALLRILDKNPLAFLPKIGSGQGSKLHRKGCNCKRSECLKNYCECREAKIECSLLCRCQGCKNRSNELSSHSSQVPCSLDMVAMDSERFKSSNVSFKSNNGLGNAKSQKENLDLNYQFRQIYNEPNVNQANAYCNGVNLSDFSSALNYPITGNSVEDMVKYNEFCKTMNDDFFKPSNLSISQSDELVDDPKPQILSWAPFVNIKAENTLDFKQLPYGNLYPAMNFCKLPPPSPAQPPPHAHTHPTSADLDDSAHRVMPDNSMQQYLHEPDEFLDLSSTYYKPYLRRFPGPQYPGYGVPLKIEDGQQGAQDDSAEVTSTNELEEGALLVSSRCDSLSQAGVRRGARCESHSPLPLVAAEQYGCCYPFAGQGATVPGYGHYKYRPSPQRGLSLNGHVLPSLFNNPSESGGEIGGRMPFFRARVGEEDLGRPLTGEDNLPKGYGGRYHGGFYNFYGEAGATPFPDPSTAPRPAPMHLSLFPDNSLLPFHYGRLKHGLDDDGGELAHN